MNNLEVRTALMKAGMKNWELAERMGILDSSLSRKLRTELPEDEKQKILKLIEDYQHRGLPHDEKNIEKV